MSPINVDTLMTKFAFENIKRTGPILAREEIEARASKPVRTPPTIFCI